MTLTKQNRWIWLLVATTVVLASVFWLGTLGQPLIDRHEFRQTQTALSALFMEPGLNGLLNYQTPVVGAPWSIPFEFPLLQWLSHHLANNTALNLSSSGRLISILFGLGCIWPANRLMGRYGLGIKAKGIFIALYLSSYIYLYWNRAFLMESAALFFTLVCLEAYGSLRSDQPKAQITIYLLAAGLGISLSLGLLVKATTALPALGLIGFDCILRTRKAVKTANGLRTQILIAIALAGAFTLLYSWTQHADALKAQNEIGALLTSSSLRAWNFGQLEQRFSSDLWVKVFTKRMLTPVAAGPIILILIAGIRKSSASIRQFILTCLYLCFAPLLIFTNLHIVHDYYQAGNQIFLLLAIAASGEQILLNAHSKRAARAAAIGIIIIICTNLLYFTFKQLPKAVAQTSDKLLIGKIIQSETSAESSILVFGDDWSSAFAYHSKRRSFTLPDWPSLNLDSADVLSNSQKYLDGATVGAVVSRNPLNPKALRQTCLASKHYIANSWHLYICRD
jgi:hypothetical protein